MNGKINKPKETPEFPYEDVYGFILQKMRERRAAQAQKEKAEKAEQEKPENDHDAPRNMEH